MSRSVLHLSQHFVTGSSHKRQLLVIEDDEIFRGVLQQLLEQAGYAVHTAHNGRDGLRRCREKAIDIVITDILMPVQEGIQTIIELRQAFPDIAVIAISGGGVFDADEYLTNAERLGASMTIAKPFRLEDILQAVTFVENARR